MPETRRKTSSNVAVEEHPTLETERPSSTPPAPSGNGVRSSIASYLWKLSFSILLFAAALHWVDYGELRTITAHPHPSYLLAYILLMFIDRVVMAYKWGFLLTAVGFKRRLGELTLIYYKGTFIGNLLPTSLGGDAIRTYEVVKRGGPFESAVSSIVMERFVGFLSAAILALAGLLLSVPLGLETPVQIFLPLGIAFGLGIACLMTVLLGGEFLQRRPGLLGKLPLARKLVKIATSVSGFRSHPGVLYRFFLWSLGEQLLPIVIMYALARGLNLDIPVPHLLCIIPVTQFLARIPVSLSGIGLQESVLMGFMSLAGIHPTVAFVLGVGSNIGAILNGLPGAYFYLTDTRRKRR